MTAAAAVEAARASPAAFLALALGKPVADLQREMLHHALTHLSWYAEIPRGHTKTSTFAYAVAWWLGVRPDTRIKIVSQTDDHAAPTSRFIRDIVRSPAFRATFPTVTLKLQMECGGNGRSFFRPQASGNQWTNGAISNAEWTGVRLRDLLQAAGLRPTRAWPTVTRFACHPCASPSVNMRRLYLRATSPCCSRTPIFWRSTSPRAWPCTVAAGSAPG